MTNATLPDDVEELNAELPLGVAPAVDDDTSDLHSTSLRLLLISMAKTEGVHSMWTTMQARSTAYEGMSTIVL